MFRKKQNGTRGGVLRANSQKADSVNYKNVYEWAVKNMDPGDICIEDGRLYLRVTPVSRDMVEHRWETVDGLRPQGTFIDQIEGVRWYDLPSAYASNQHYQKWSHRFDHLDGGVHSDKNRRQGLQNGEVSLEISFNKSNRTVTDDALTEIFTDVGKKHGYKEVKATFIEFNDPKIRWQRTYGWAEFQVSDYLDRAPKDVLTELAESLFARFDGKGSEISPDSLLVSHLNTPEIQGPNRADFLQRGNFSSGPDGSNVNLMDSFNRLVKKGLLPPDFDVTLRWDEAPSNRAGTAHFLVGRIVTINSKLEDAPPKTLDYVVYSLCCILMCGYASDEEQVEALRKKYPGRKKILKQLTDLEIYAS